MLNERTATASTFKNSIYILRYMVYLSKKIPAYYLQLKFSHQSKKKSDISEKGFMWIFSEKELNENTFHSQFCDKTSERTMTKLRLHTWGNVTQIHS